MTQPNPRRTRRSVGAIACAGLLVAGVVGCGSDDDGGGGGGGDAVDSFTFLGINENTTIPSVITTLSEDECSSENAALPLDQTTQAQGNLDQQLQLLAGQDALPPLFTSASSPSLTQDLAEAGNVLDIGTTDLADNIVPAAADSIASLYDGDTLVLPTELNIEGIWYNQDILDENGIAVPQTWDELVDAFATLQSADVQPISNAGAAADGWGITRWVGAYLYRSLGPDALQAVADGDAQLTDPEYVEAAQAIADLGDAGYFGPSPTSVDYATSINTFLTGDAAFLYMGSWAVSAFNDPEQNSIGEDAIGFMPFPDVSGGAGDASQLPANVGTSVAVSASAYEDSPEVQAWVTCIAENYGTVALRDAGQITGFTVPDDVEVAPLTQLVQDQIADTDETLLWFEGLFPPAATTASQTNGGLLGSGQLSGEEFMSTVSNALG